MRILNGLHPKKYMKRKEFLILWKKPMKPFSIWKEIHKKNMEKASKLIIFRTQFCFFLIWLKKTPHSSKMIVLYSNMKKLLNLPYFHSKMLKTLFKVIPTQDASKYLNISCPTVKIEKQFYQIFLLVWVDQTEKQLHRPSERLMNWRRLWRRFMG